MAMRFNSPSPYRPDRGRFSRSHAAQSPRIPASASDDIRGPASAGISPGRATYVPDPARCLACKHAQADCRGLPFNTMPVARTGGSGHLIVRCTEFVPARD